MADILRFPINVKTIETYARIFQRLAEQLEARAITGQNIGAFLQALLVLQKAQDEFAREIEKTRPETYQQRLAAAAQHTLMEIADIFPYLFPGVSPNDAA